MQGKLKLKRPKTGHLKLPCVTWFVVLLTWCFYSFGSHPYLNITLSNICCQFTVQLIESFALKK